MKVIRKPSSRVATAPPAEFLLSSVNVLHIKTKKRSKPIWHFVYASELYGTLFGVFAQFNRTSLKNGDVQVTGLSLKIVNYKGVVNVGFASGNYDGETISPVSETTDSEDGVAIPAIRLSVRGGSTLLSQKKLTLQNPITIKQGQPCRVNFLRLLYPLKGFDFTIGQWKRLGTTKAVTHLPAKTQLFDSEFFYREGTHIYFNELRPGMWGCPEGKYPPLFPHWRCSQSAVSLFA